LLKASDVKPASNIPLKKRFTSLLMASEARVVFPVCAVEKVFPPTYITAGVKVA
jgi:hypothetical protein